MNKYPDLTYKVIAFPALEDVNMDDAVDWAYEMLVMGYETPTLLMLAGMTKPTNYFEISYYLKETLKELQLRELNREESKTAYITYLLSQIIKLKDTRKWLSLLHLFLLSEDEHGHEFCMLYYAITELDYNGGQNGMQYYWDGADRNNIENIIVEEANKWLKQNENVINHLI